MRKWNPRTLDKGSGYSFMYIFYSIRNLCDNKSVRIVERVRDTVLRERGDVYYLKIILSLEHGEKCTKKDVCQWIKKREEPWKSQRDITSKCVRKRLREFHEFRKIVLDRTGTQEVYKVNYVIGKVLVFRECMEVSKKRPSVMNMWRGKIEAETKKTMELRI